MATLGIISAAAQLAELGAELAVMLFHLYMDVKRPSCERVSAMDEMKFLIDTAKYIEQHPSIFDNLQLHSYLQSAVEHAETLKILLGETNQLTNSFSDRLWRAFQRLDQNKIRHHLEKLHIAKAYLVFHIQLDHSRKLSIVEGGVRKLLQKSRVQLEELDTCEKTISEEMALNEHQTALFEKEEDISIDLPSEIVQGSIVMYKLSGKKNPDATGGKLRFMLQPDQQLEKSQLMARSLPPINQSASNPHIRLPPMSPQQRQQPRNVPKRRLPMPGHFHTIINNSIGMNQIDKKSKLNNNFQAHARSIIGMNIDNSSKDQNITDGSEVSHDMVLVDEMFHEDINGMYVVKSEENVEEDEVRNTNGPALLSQK